MKKIVGGNGGNSGLSLFYHFDEDGLLFGGCS